LSDVRAKLRVPTYSDRGMLANVVAFLLALAASVLLLVVPVYNSERSSTLTDGSRRTQPVTTTVSRSTLLQENGPAVLVTLSVPLLVTVVPLLPRGTARRGAWRLASALVLTVLCILAGFSIGLFYLPAAVALWVAAMLSVQTKGAEPGVSYDR
jgi:hypothetical protein